ncbi:MAG TPA: T9SS type A sorting domain-containing protein [Flavobacteriales bacterium]|nr:T9SS type A sorting domain-containing protein [Flavobacteriales bacterium]
MRNLLLITLLSPLAASAQTTFSTLQYWFDQSHDNPASIVLPADVTVDAVVPDIPVSGLSAGYHRMHYRLQDSNGRWSAVLYRNFKVRTFNPHELVLLRYWSDPAITDPSDMTEVPIDPGVQYLDVVDDILFCQWSTLGNTNVYFQLKDDHALWSAVITRSLDVDLVTAPPVLIGPIDGPPTPAFGSMPTYSIAANNAAGYTWSLPTGWTGSSTGPSVTVQVGSDNDGSQLCVRAWNGCGESEPVCLDISTGLNTQQDAGGVVVFPNPTTGQFTIAVNSPITRLAVYNSTGQLVREQSAPGTGRAALDLEGEAAGLYTVRVFQGEARMDLRVMLQR